MLSDDHRKQVENIGVAARKAQRKLEKVEQNTWLQAARKWAESKLFAGMQAGSMKPDTMQQAEKRQGLKQRSVARKVVQHCMK